MSVMVGIDLIDYILSNDLSDETKRVIKDKRPTPYVPMTLNEKKQNRVFQRNWYRKFKWLTGCLRRKKLYCYYCLIFGGDVDWGKVGISTIKNLDVKATRHQATRVHIRNSELFHMLGKLQVHTLPSESSLDSIGQYNEKVSANRRVLTRFIQGAIYLSGQELPVFTEEGSREGCYTGLMNYTAQEEQSVRDYLLKTDLKLNTPEAQRAILEAMKTTVKKKIRQEVYDATFVSVQVDETSDVNSRNRVSVIFRYCKEDKIVERFIGFYAILKNKGPEVISESIVNILKEWSPKVKFLSQTYDGALLMTAPISVNLDRPDAVSDWPPTPTFHSYNHNLHLVLLHGCKTNVHVKRFIADLEAFDLFFNKSSQRMKVIVEQCLQSSQENISHWNFHARGVTTILAYYNELMQIFDQISGNSPIEFDSYTYGTGLVLQDRMSQPIFVYLLFLFQEIFFFVDQIESNVEISSIRSVLTFQKEVNTVIENISKIKSEETIKNCIENSKNLNSSLNYSDVNMFSLTYNIIDTIVLHLKRRFESLDQLQFLEILNEKAFLRYKVAGFPDTVLKRTIVQYGAHFQPEQLKNELFNIFADDEKHLPPEQLLKYLHINGLHEVYTETSKLLKLALTLPVLKRSGESNTLKVIKSYLRKCAANDQLSALEVLAIEKSLVSELSSDVAFINEVIDNFGRTNPGVQLQYKRW